jgi:hypothetical protein
MKPTPLEQYAAISAMKTTPWLPEPGEPCEVTYEPEMGRWWPDAELIGRHGDWLIFRRAGKLKPLIRSDGKVAFRKPSGERTPVEPAIRACPFCGGADELEIGFSRYVECGSCMTYGPNGTDRIDAINKWNERDK